MNLNVAMQQMVAIARAVSFGSRLVIMDEPTSSLDEREVETLFEAIRQLKASGVSVIYISHRFTEIAAICDRATVLRDGMTVGDVAIEPGIEERIVILGGTYAVFSEENGGTTIMVSAPVVDLPELLVLEPHDHGSGSAVV